MPLRSSATATSTTITAKIVRACFSRNVPRPREHPPGPVGRDEQRNDREPEWEDRREREEEPIDAITGRARIRLRDRLERDRDEAAGVGKRRAGGDDRDPRRARDRAHLLHHCRFLLRVERLTQLCGDPEQQQRREHDVEDRDPRLRRRRRRRRGDVAEHERRQDADRDGRNERAEPEQDPRAQRPLREHEREDGERERRRREHRRERDEHQLGVDPSHAAGLYDAPPTGALRCPGCPTSTTWRMS